MAFTPIYGRWSDIFGRKPILLVVLFIFWIGSLGGALSHTMTQLITFRAIQGIGGGGKWFWLCKSIYWLTLFISSHYHTVLNYVSALGTRPEILLLIFVQNKRHRIT